MLGRLLHLGSGGSTPTSTQPQASNSRPVSSLDSVQEDIHTRNLLFPDAQSLFQQRNDQVFPLSPSPTTAPSTQGGPNAFDSNDDVDIDLRDVRVLVMQDTLGHMNASLLYDSHPGPVTAPAAERPNQSAEPRRATASSRKGSLGHISRPMAIQSENQPPRQGAFDRRGSVHGAFDRRGSIHGRAHSSAESDTQRAAREYREELATFSSCIFGNSELMSYKGTSTKVHVVPVESRTHDNAPSILGDGRSSIGRSATRSSKLSQSFTSQTYSSATAPSSSAYCRPVERKKVLITRLFPVSISNEENPIVTPQSRFSDDNLGFPFPSAPDDFAPRKKPPQPRQRRTPMYAIVLVVQLPPARTSSGATPRSAFRESGSYNEQDFFSSSFSSTRPSWFNTTTSGLYGELTDSSYSLDVEDRIDSLTQHWDIVIRTLTHLQSTIASSLRTLLKQSDIASPDPLSLAVQSQLAQQRSPSSTDRRSMELPRSKPSKSTVKLLSLPPNCLSTDVVIAAEMNLARRRIVTGLKAARVVTGQGRWGIWRDEAIHTLKWTQTLGQGPFLYTLFTGFLAIHTDWLQALCPPSYRRRFLQNRRTRVDDDLSLPSRTVIVSDDKMAARRLIFLLSAFLPANQQLPTNRPHRPSTSTSMSGFSHSPPTYIVPVLREESLRRKVNRRTGTHRASHSRTASQSTRPPPVLPQYAQFGMDRGRERRASDAASIRTTSLAMPNHDIVSRKSSAATTTTIMPEMTLPHFSTLQASDISLLNRPESRHSIATDDLKRSLQRGESSGYASTASTDARSQSSKWGSVISGLWSPRRRDSASMSSPGQPSDTKLPSKVMSPRKDMLSEMVEEVAYLRDAGELGPEARNQGPGPRAVRTKEARRERLSFAHPDRPAGPSGVFESPVKTSVNTEDGVIDVDFPFPEYIASFESAISSPSSSGYLSTPGLPGGLDSFENLARPVADGDLPLNAAGWLNCFHPDFALQAVPPQHDLLVQVKATLRSEPTPIASLRGLGDTSEQWVEVGSVIIADATSSTVHRIALRRLVRLRSLSDRVGSNNVGLTSFPAGTPQTPTILPYETPLEEQWTEETILQPDQTLKEAMEKALSVNMDVIREAVPNQVQGGECGSNTNDPAVRETSPEVAAPPPNMSETPRIQCKTVVLSALEDIVRDAIDHRERRRTNDLDVPLRKPQSLLTGAVRDWISDIDSAE